MMPAAPVYPASTMMRRAGEQRRERIWSANREGNDGEWQMARERRTITGAQNISRMCLVCGAENAAGLHARFYELEQAGRVAGVTEGDAAGAGPPAAPAEALTERELLGVFTPGEVHQSYPGRLHGGISSAILDETIGRAVTMIHPGAWGVTVELTLRYRQPVPLDDEIRAVGRITRDTPRLFEGTGEILLGDGTVAVEARGKYLKMDLEQIAQGGLDETEWFADERELPAGVDMAAPDDL